MDLYGKLTLQSANGSKLSLFGFNYTDNVSNYQSIANYDWYNYGGGANFAAVTGNNAIIEASVFNTDLRAPNVPVKTDFDEVFDVKYSSLMRFAGDVNANITLKGVNASISYRMV